MSRLPTLSPIAVIIGTVAMPVHLPAYFRLIVGCGLLLFGSGHGVPVLAKEGKLSPLPQLVAIAQSPPNPFRNQQPNSTDGKSNPTQVKTSEKSRVTVPIHSISRPSTGQNETTNRAVSTKATVAPPSNKQATPATIRPKSVQVAKVGSSDCPITIITITNNEPRSPVAEGSSKIEQARKLAPVPPPLLSQATSPAPIQDASDTDIAAKIAPLPPQLRSAIVLKEPAFIECQKLMTVAPAPILTLLTSVPIKTVDAIASDVAPADAPGHSAIYRLPNSQSTTSGETTDLVQAEEVLVVPSQISPNLEELNSPYPQPQSSAAIEISDDLEIDETMMNCLSIDIRPRKHVASVNDKGDDTCHTGELVDRLPGNQAGDGMGTYDLSATASAQARTANYREFVWAAPAFHHRPLYFEQRNLERYGYFYGGSCLQSAVSAAHFFATIPLLPYKITAHKPHECNYTLGHYRPGNCAPNCIQCCDINLTALTVEGVAAAGCAVILY